ncbi:polyphosphate polymerase domain-containing protein [Faecalicatena contorta]|uniref:VTC domain-containing protein n=1 Tax=Faecalicatena contorta TaxID=39482 RepID=A0A316AAU5_9FIRM|nr:polyphosphate polymerase domain-containing protein [Faecalicatena contorta]PWJ46937.1 VTC domain-containing protein [Faecalicatena contorta]SUQ16265.1 VTC domain-containing protein [Faecalicatena contorta]
MKKFRHELKHYINPLDHAELSCKLKALLKPDENAAKGHYLVKSLYFDNYEDKVLREKVNGYLYREKFRLRLYDSNNSFIKLERRMKLNGLCHKASARITESHCERLLLGDYGVLKEIDSSVAAELYAKIGYQLLRPKSIVEYHREAYVYKAGNVRITIDSDIRASNQPDRFLSEKSLSFRPSKETILEVKYDEFIPQFIKDIIQIHSRQTAAFSKYAAARII